MSTYHPQSQGHLALSRLSEGSATLTEIRDACGASHESARSRRKVWYVMRALKDDGFAASADGLYFIRNAGRSALERIRSGETVFTGDQHREAGIVFRDGDQGSAGANNSRAGIAA